MMAIKYSDCAIPKLYNKFNELAQLDAELDQLNDPMRTGWFTLDYSVKFGYERTKLIDVLGFTQEQLRERYMLYLTHKRTDLLIDIAHLLIECNTEDFTESKIDYNH